MCAAGDVATGLLLSLAGSGEPCPLPCLARVALEVVQGQGVAAFMAAGVSAS